MKKLYLLFAAVLITAGASVSAVAHPMDVTSLVNKDIVLMVERGVGPDLIIKTIKSSPCTFDTFPSVMKELKRRGVPETVLQAMIDAPYGPPAEAQVKGEEADEPIYHYMESIKQYLTPVNTGRRVNPTTNRTRAARTRIRR
ncbi:MAG TPA: hypothetical protein VFZ22_11610 [Pyrinomonadaceae bacterium]|nr:hypothetical protein [Pyrinomonadaceae bacterium]